MKRIHIILICIAAVVVVATAATAGMLIWKKPALVSNAPPDVKITASTSVAKVADDARIVMLVGSPRSLVKDKLVLIDPTDGRIIPLVVNNSVLVPVRFVAESTGGTVDWNAETKTAQLKYASKTFTIADGDTAIKTGAETTTLAAAARADNNRLFVPLDGICQALGLNMSMKDGLIVISSGRIDTASDEYASIVDSASKRIANLKSVGTAGNLLSLIKNNWKGGVVYDRLGAAMNQAPAAADAAAAKGSAESTSAQNGDYSTTNVQVEGVDEADVVKTDGKYIYTLSKGTVKIVNADPASDMSVAATLSYSNYEFVPMEMYVDAKYLTVIGTYNTNVVPINIPQTTGGGDTSGSSGAAVAPKPAIAPDAKMGMPYYYNYSYTRIYVYDITDKTNPQQVRYVDIDGSYASSRKIGSSVYLVSNKFSYWYGAEPAENTILPAIRDSAVGGDFATLPPEKVFYYSESFTPGYMIVAGINLDKITEPANISSYLGAGMTIYASLDNLYVTYGESSQVRNGDQVTSSNDTRVYKFSLKDGEAIYLGNTLVPGSILNQFSMDEYNGNFRLATTVQKWSYTETKSSDGTTTSIGTVSSSSGNGQDNNVYVYDSALNLLGSIEKMAPGERVYSARFMGKRAYMVTYKQVDPLFVIDLTDPAAPVVLGQLKIPGFSDYLHPYDETHIIGFGKDTVDTGERALMMGMKVAIFDVTDPTNPIQKFSMSIGDRGTYSELLNNHKALLFSKEKNIIAFPVSLYEIPNKGNYTAEQLAGVYGTFTYQGLYVYGIDENYQLTLKGRISHGTELDWLQYGSTYSTDVAFKFVTRGLYIGDQLYTLSESMLKANSLTDLSEIRTLPF